jgi:hypothetical protein
MTCRKALEVDLAAFLLDPRSAEWDAFRAHYPGCPECAAEVAAWTNLGTQLGSSHPTPEALLQWVDEPISLTSAERAAMRAHLARCRACADELRALGRFEGAWRATRAAAAPLLGARLEPAMTAEPSTRPAFPVTDSAETTSAGHRASALRGARVSRAGESRRASLRRWSRVLWNPAVPYAALLALLLLPAVRARLTADRRPPMEPVVAATSAPVPAAVPAASPAPPAPVAIGEPARRDLPREAVDGGVAARAAARPSGGEVDLAGGRSEPGAVPRAAPLPPAPERAAAQGPAGSAPELATESAGPATAAQSAKATSLAAVDVASGDQPRTLILSSLTPAGTRKLVIPLPGSGSLAPPVEVRVRDEAGDRELRQRFPTLPSSSEISLDLPAAWLRSGKYEVDLHSEAGVLLSRNSLVVR